MGMALLQDHANLFSRMFPCQMIVMLTRGYVVGCSLSLKSSGLYRLEWKQNWLVGVPICTCSISKGCFGPSISFSHNDDQSHGKHPREAIGTCPCIYYEYDVSVSSQDHMEETPEASGFLHFKSLYASFSSCVPFCQGLASTFSSSRLLIRVPKHTLRQLRCRAKTQKRVSAASFWTQHPPLLWEQRATEFTVSNLSNWFAGSHRAEGH